MVNVFIGAVAHSRAMGQFEFKFRSKLFMELAVLAPEERVT